MHSSNRSKQQSSIYTGLRNQQIMWIGTISAIMLAGVLLMQDVSYLGVNVANLQVRTPSHSVKPGDIFTYEMVILFLNEGEAIDIETVLPSGLSFVPNSLEIESEPSFDFSVNVYEGASQLKLGNVKGPQQNIRLRIGVQVPMDFALLEKKVLLETQYLWRGQSFQPDPEQSRAELDIQLPPISLDARLVAGSWEIDQQLSCEVLLYNPIDGMDFSEEDFQFRLEHQLPTSSWSIIPASVKIEGAWSMGQIFVRDQQFSVEELAIAPGDIIAIYFELAGNPGSEVPNQLGTTTIRIPQCSITYTKEVLYQPNASLSWGNMEVYIQRNQAQLRWETLREAQSERFEIEESQDGMEFIFLGDVPASGSSTTLRKYVFDLPELPIGEHIFRIRQVSQSGAISYSRQIRWLPASLPSPKVSVLPNPLRNKGEITLSAPCKQRIHLSLLNEQKEFIQSFFKGVMLAGEKRSIQVDAGQWDSGTYLLQVKNRWGTETRAILKEGTPPPTDYQPR